MKYEAVILAAGYSSRAGTNKMLLDLHGISVLGRCIHTFYELCANIIVVGGHQIKAIMPVARQYEKVRLVLNRDYHSGMFSSVKEGLRHTTAERIFITPGDYPAIKRETLLTIICNHSDIVIPSYNDIQGHPLCIHKSLINEILNGESKDLHDFIRKKQPSILRVEDEGILKDIDYMEDYDEIARMLQ